MKILKWIICILTILSTVFMLFILPDTVPVHFDINGTADRWGSKFELLILPVVLIACAFILDPMAKSYRKKAAEADNEKEKVEHLSNAKVLSITGIVTMCLFFVINLLTLYSVYMEVTPNSALPKIDIFQVIGVVMGITFIALGNYMPKTRKNSNIGFRLPWTQYNDVTWSKSNRFAGYVLMISGLVAIIGAIFTKGMLSTVIMVGSLLTSIPIIVIYAYVVYKKEKSK